MQGRFSRSTVAAVLLSASVSTPSACPVADSATSPRLQTEAAIDPDTTSALPRGDELVLALTSNSAPDVAFALDDWVILLDHEGESFTVVVHLANKPATRGI